MRQVILRQVYFTGVQAFRLIALGAAIFGLLTVSQSAAQLTRFGGSSAIGSIVVAAFFRDLGPLVTVVVVVSRSVSAIASELASMKANGEIDGLRAVGVSPLSYLVVPRVISGAIATLFLAMHFVWVALLTGFFTAQIFIEMPLDRYLDNILGALNVSDLVIFFVKTATLGSLAFLLACYCGLRTTGASYEVPQATTKAVVWSFMFCFALQVLISGLYYFFLFQNRGFGGFL